MNKLSHKSVPSKEKSNSELKFKNGRKSKVYLRVENDEGFVVVMEIVIVKHFWKIQMKSLYFRVIHKWRHANLHNFWPTSSHCHTFHYEGLSTANTKSKTSSPLRRLRHLWTIPLPLKDFRFIFKSNFVFSKRLELEHQRL